MKRQVSKEHYNESYDNLKRFISYYYQIDLVRKTNAKKVLEIGIGNKTVSNYLKEAGFNLTTCDIDKELNPDKVADIRKLPFKDNEFEIVLAYEILEHLPWKESKKALSELKRVSKNHVIISLPHFSADFEIAFKFPAVGKLTGKPFLKLLIPFPLNFIKKSFDGQHYWEIGYKGFCLRKIKKELKKNFKIIKNFRAPLDSRHHFFILRNFN
jgi:ubiquinone/menaquinone biosynthesis C-methylase UbiE